MICSGVNCLLPISRPPVDPLNKNNLSVSFLRGRSALCSESKNSFSRFLPRPWGDGGLGRLYRLIGQMAGSQLLIDQLSNDCMSFRGKMHTISIKKQAPETEALRHKMLA